MRKPGLTPSQRTLKRTLDLLLATPALIIVSPLIIIGVIIAAIDTRESGIFSQERIGRNGVPFYLYKIRTMRTSTAMNTDVTRRGDPRVTHSGRVMRTLKLDELPQLFNVVRGQMSLVGPRPDVAGFADRLTGPDRIILTVRPGVTGPATIAYRHEEALLEAQTDPERFNREVLWPDKVRINREYVESYSIRSDIAVIGKTFKRIIKLQETETY